MSSKARFWLGVALAVPVLMVLGVLFTLVLGGVTSATADTGLQSAVAVGCLALVVGGWAALVAWRRTRMTALGALAGVAVIAVVLGGACVAILAAVSGSY